MRLSDAYLLSIVYLGYAQDIDRAIDPVGTGFLLSHDDSTYIVTAAHVAKDFEDSAFAVRLNRTDTGLGQVDRIDSAQWYFHQDDKVDVAVLPYTAPPWAHVKYIKSKTIISDFKRETKDIGVGDLAYVVGIFKSIRAMEKNVPVVHTGNIASMADGEPILANDWRSPLHPKPLMEIRGYLVQSHTGAQSSGSPVFVRRSIELPKTRGRDAEGDGDPNLRVWAHGSLWLLGLWHGSWVNDVAAAMQIAEVVQGRASLGTGMGVCIPAPRIVEALNHDALVLMRRAAKASPERVAAVAEKKAFRIGFKRANAKRAMSKKAK